MRDGQERWAADAARHERAMPRARRKRDGVWFTPMELALPTARRTLAPLLANGPDLAICDPAVGGGSFLLAAAKELGSERSQRCSFAGVDIDQHATELAQRALRDAGARSVDVHCGDGLTELADGSFDCVLTNPPWETLQDGADRRALAKALRPRFEHQGKGKLYTYRLFLERAVQLLRPGGRLGAIVPASLWFDREAQPLRRLLLEHCRWQWLFGFENRERIFEIDSRYRFGIVIATKGRATRAVKVAFGRTTVAEWAQADPPHVLFERNELQQLSPHSGAFVEVESRRDLTILARMHRRGVPLLNSQRGLKWRQGDFNMTSARHQFVLREEAERDGYRHDGHGCWRCPEQPELLALHQGAMVYDLEANAGAHESGHGHKTRWRKPGSPDELRPLYLVDAAAWRAGAAARAPARIALRALSNATNERTAIACLLPDVPCGNSLGVITPAADETTPVLQLAATAAMLASLPFDWALRLRLAGTNLNRFVLTDCVLPKVDEPTRRELAALALRMCGTAPFTRPLWRAAQQEGWRPAQGPATQEFDRRQLATRIDVVVGSAFGIRPDEATWICRGQPFAKGFWRIETELPADQRRPARWLRAMTAR